MSHRHANAPCLVENALVFVLELAVCGLYVAEEGWGVFQYYTNLSNAFAGAACGVALVVELRCRAKGTDVPRWCCTLKLTAASGLLVTFLIVALFLAPGTAATTDLGYFALFTQGRWPLTHALCPALTILSYLRHEGACRPTRREGWWTFWLTFAYAGVAYLMNALRLWVGPYPFFQVWDYPPAFIVAMFFALCALIGCACQLPGMLARRIWKGKA